MGVRILMAPKWGGGIVDISVTSSRKPTQQNRDGGSGRYPRVRGENVRWLGEKGVGLISKDLWQVVGRWFAVNGQDSNRRGEQRQGENRQARSGGTTRNGTGWLGENPSYWKGAGSTLVGTVTQTPVVGVDGRRVVVGR